MKITGIDLHVLLVPDYDAGAVPRRRTTWSSRCTPTKGSWASARRTRTPGSPGSASGPGGRIAWGWASGDAPRRRPDAARGDLGEALPRLEDDRPARGLDLRHGGDRHGPLGHQGQGAGRARLHALLGGDAVEAGHAVRLAPADGHGRSTRTATRWSRRRWRAKALGFRAAKLEVCVNGPYSHNGFRRATTHVVEIVAACRAGGRARDWC